MESMETLAGKAEKEGVKTVRFESELLQRTVLIDLYETEEIDNVGGRNLLLVNDGGQLRQAGMDGLLKGEGGIPLLPLTVAAIHGGENREQELGMSTGPDYLGRGTKAAWYEQFVISELLPFLGERQERRSFRETAIAGFGQGALSAFDIAWNNPDIFNKVGVLSGIMGWRSVAREDRRYDDSQHRMLHLQVRNGTFRRGMKFFFQCGFTNDGQDLNRNGVIDSVDDTIDLMRELVRKGYQEGAGIRYVQDGKSRPGEWLSSFQRFLQWGWIADTSN